MKVYNMLQGSDEWKAIRKGKLTASNATAIGNNGTGLKTYIRKIILALIIEPEFKSSKDTDRGHELEPIARAKYEFENNLIVKQVGFIEHCPYSGYSPDGLVGNDGLIEIKARNDAKHLALLMYGKVESSTVWQMNMGMLASERKWCDFISYNPNFKQSMFVLRFTPCPIKQEKLIIGLESGIKSLKEALNNKAIKLELYGNL